MKTELNFKENPPQDFSMICSNKEREDPNVGIHLVFKVQDHEYRFIFSRQQAIDIQQGLGVIIMQDTDFDKYENIVKLPRLKEIEKHVNDKEPA